MVNATMVAFIHIDAHGKIWIPMQHTTAMQEVDVIIQLLEQHFLRIGAATKTVLMKVVS